MNIFDKMAQQVRELTPKTGYNIVHNDRYRAPGDDDAIGLLAHTEDPLEAARLLKVFREGSPEETYYVYSAEDAAPVPGEEE